MMHPRFSHNLLLVVMAVLTMALVPVCSDTGVTPPADTVDPGGESSQVSSDKPEVRFYPQDGRTHVIPGTAIELHFNVDMDEEGSWSVWIGGTEYTGVSTDARWDGRALIIEPQSWFGPLEPVTVTATGFASAGGIALGDRSITFTVMDYGSASGTISPANGGSGVDPVSSIVITFTEVVVDDESWSVRVVNGDSGIGAEEETMYNTASPSAEVAWSSGGAVLTIHPSSPLFMGAPVSVEASGFTTAYAGTAVTVPDSAFTIAPPTVDFNPSNGISNVSPVANVVLTFNTSVNTGNGWSVSIGPDVYTCDDESFISWNNNVLTINPDGYFSSLENVTVTASGFTSSDGYPVVGNPIVFTVMSYVDPTLIIIPADGSVNVCPESRVFLSFSSEVENDVNWSVCIDGDEYKKGDDGVIWIAEGTLLAIDPPDDFSLGDVVHVTASGFTSKASATPVDMREVTFTIRSNYDFTIEDISVATGVVPSDSGALTFPLGLNDNGDVDGDGDNDVQSPAEINHSYVMGQSEVTYKLWKQVHDWAITHGYSFKNAGSMGGKYEGWTENNTEEHPVTDVSWRDIIVWCNALTEYCNEENGTDLECVYYSDATYTTLIRSSLDGGYGGTVNSNPGSFDNPYIKAASAGNTDMANCSANGFRLPTSREWELAARWCDDDIANTVPPFSNPYFTNGVSASGATTSVVSAPDSCESDAATDAVAWNYCNSGESGKTGKHTRPVMTAAANALGLYDMSGNVWEWMSDYKQGTDYSRLQRGGGFGHFRQYLRIGLWYEGVHEPYYKMYHTGFRFARTIEE